MKIIHLFREEKFRKTVSDFYEAFFNNGEHTLGYVNIEGRDSMIRDDLTIGQQEVYIKSLKADREDMDRIRRMTEGYDYIVFHSYFLRNPEAVRYLALHRKMLKRIVWIEWGYDLYDWKVKVEKFSDRLTRWFGKTIRTKCNTFIAIFPPDIDYYKKRFPDATAKIECAQYGGPKSPERFKHYSEYRRLTETREKGETVYIQVGNRSYPELHHIHTMSMLRKFAEEDIMLVIPLSYGPVKYGKKVRAYAEKHFPGKNMCLMDFMPQDEYFELLKRVDIAIFDTDRQIALGNILTLIFDNVKLYLPDTNVMSRYFRDRGVPIQSLADIKKGSFEDLTADYVIEDQDKFDEYLRTQYNNADVKRRQWEEIYDKLRAAL